MKQGIMPQESSFPLVRISTLGMFLLEKLVDFTRSKAQLPAL